jgi:hypothetical protein
MGKFDKEIAFTVHERKLITHHLVTRVTPKTRKQRRFFDAIFTALQLDDYEHELKTTNTILPDDENDKTPERFVIESEPLEYLLDSFNTEVPGGQARTILQIEDRLAAVKDGSYMLPAQLLSPQPSEDDGPVPDPGMGGNTGG